MRRDIRVAVVGGGIGGLAVAGLLQRAGFPGVEVHEQAPGPQRIGAGIILSPNAMAVLRRLGVETALLAAGIRPAAFTSRDWASGATTYECRFDAAAEKRFGGAFLNIHRADLHAILASALRPGTLRYGRRLEGMEPYGDGVRLFFADGARVEADIAIGGDGIHSRLREMLWGAQPPRFTGRMAQRAIFPTSRLRGASMADCTKWWGEDRHALTYFMTGARNEVYVMASVPGAAWDGSDLSRPLPRAAFLDSFAAACPELRAIVAAAETCAVWPICDRPRDDRWFAGPCVLLGDACHPVRPYMAAGGASAIEDAAVLARCIAAFDGPADAFACYTATRIPRVAEVQRISIANTWMHGPEEELDWFFGHDASAAPLAAPVAA